MLGEEGIRESVASRRREEVDKRQELYFFKLKTAYEFSLGLVGSEMCMKASGGPPHCPRDPGDPGDGRS